MPATATAVARFGGVAPEAIAHAERADARSDEMAAAAGILNATYGHLVDVAVACRAEGDHCGPGLHSLGQYLAWRLGIAPATARAIAAVAKRAGELPVLCAALRAGEISLDQAAVVARNVPATFDRSATELAKVCTVAQLATVLPYYRQRPNRPDRPPTGVSITRSDDGTARISGVLDADQAALINRALDAMRDDLYRQRREDAATLAAESGDEPATVQRPNGADALAALAETALQTREAAHPNTSRTLVSYHLQATADGHFLLIDDHGLVIDEPERRRILCDHRFETVLHNAQGTALSVGRRTRHITAALRRTILHRHQGRCAVPGCPTTRGLEIHHIIHWEDGGPTNTANLIALCARHHRAHHHDQLHIEGNPDHHTLHIGPPHRPLTNAANPHPTPIDPDHKPVDQLRHHTRCRLHTDPPPHATTPLGEPLDHHAVTLNPHPPP